MKNTTTASKNVHRHSKCVHGNGVHEDIKSVHGTVKCVHETVKGAHGTLKRTWAQDSVHRPLKRTQQRENVHGNLKRTQEKKSVHGTIKRTQEQKSVHGTIKRTQNQKSTHKASKRTCCSKNAHNSTIKLIRTAFKCEDMIEQQFETAMNRFGTAEDINTVQNSKTAFPSPKTAFESAVFHSPSIAEERNGAQHSQTAFPDTETAFESAVFHSLMTSEERNEAQHSQTAFPDTETALESAAFHRLITAAAMNTEQETNTAFNSLGTAEEVRREEYSTAAFEPAARDREAAQHHLTLEPAVDSSTAERERETVQHLLTALEPATDPRTATRKAGQHHLTARESATNSSTAARKTAQHHLTSLKSAAALKTWIQNFYHLLLCVLLFCAVAVTAKEFGIECMCSTSECLERGEQTCSSPESYCYYQVFFSSDGVPTVTQGCLTKGWSLLCENQAPSVGHNGTWPHLLCCSTHRCNTVPPPPPVLPPVSPDVPPTVPPTSTTEKQNSLHRLGVSSIEELHQKYGGSNVNGDDIDDQEPTTIHLNALHLAIISAAVFFMLGITALGFCVLAKYRVDYKGRILTQEEENQKTPRSLPMEPLLSV